MHRSRVPGPAPARCVHHRKQFKLVFVQGVVGASVSDIFKRKCSKEECCDGGGGGGGGGSDGSGGETKESGVTRTQLLALLHSLESRSQHPIASAIVAAAEEEKAHTSLAVQIADESFEVVAGQGVRAKTKSGISIAAGNGALVRTEAVRAGIPLPDGKELPLSNIAEQWARDGGTVGWVVVSGRAVGAYCLRDSPRPEAPDAVDALQGLGVECFMLTGDNDGSAKAVARMVGIAPSAVRSELLPRDKVKAVVALKRENGLSASSSALHLSPTFRSSSSSSAPLLLPLRHPSDYGSMDDDENEIEAGIGGGAEAKVAMVGDGINDAPALAVSDVGFAMGLKGSSIAIETADVVLVDSRVDKLAKAIHIGRAVRRKIWQNILFSIVLKIAIITLSLSGYAYLWLAIMADVGSMLVVTLNGMSVLSWRA